MKFKRFEMPIFCGEKPDAWVYEAETYFDMHSLTELEKVKVSICTFDPDTVDWFRYAHNRKAILTWPELKKRIFDRFRPSQEGNLMSRFLAIKQETTVAEFRKRFEFFPATIPGLAEEVMENTFLSGLCLAIRAEVISRRPVGLDEIMKEAQLVEDRNLAIELAWEEIRPKTESASRPAANTKQLPWGSTGPGASDCYRKNEWA